MKKKITLEELRKRIERLEKKALDERIAQSFKDDSQDRVQWNSEHYI